MSVQSFGLRWLHTVCCFVLIKSDWKQISPGRICKYWSITGIEFTIASTACLPPPLKAVLLQMCKQDGATRCRVASLFRNCSKHTLRVGGRASDVGMYWRIIVTNTQRIQGFTAEVKPSMLFCSVWMVLFFEKHCARLHDDA